MPDDEQKENTVTALPSDAPLRPALARFLLDHADRRGWVGVEPPEIAVQLRKELHEVVHVLWDLQGQGYLKFREKDSSSGKGKNDLTALRLTSNGRRAFQIQQATPGDARLAVDRASEAKRPKGRGIGTVAPGGPVEVVKPDGTTSEREAAVEPPSEPVYGSPEAIAAATAEAKAAAADFANPWAVGSHERVETFGDDTGTMRGLARFKPEPADYPAIARLLSRQDDLFEAAALLERAGKVDMARDALEAAEGVEKSYTPIEADAARLWRAVTRD